ncbi:MAG: hypothetical protein R2723_08135 [Microbacterium sp.]
MTCVDLVEREVRVAHLDVLRQIGVQLLRERVELMGDDVVRLYTSTATLATSEIADTVNRAAGLCEEAPRRPSS